MAYLKEFPGLRVRRGVVMTAASVDYVAAQLVISELRRVGSKLEVELLVSRADLRVHNSFRKE